MRRSFACRVRLATLSEHVCCHHRRCYLQPGRRAQPWQVLRQTLMVVLRKRRRCQRQFRLCSRQPLVGARRLIQSSRRNSRRGIALSAGVLLQRVSLLTTRSVSLHRRPWQHALKAILLWLSYSTKCATYQRSKSHMRIAPSRARRLPKHARRRLRRSRQSVSQPRQINPLTLTNQAAASCSLKWRISQMLKIEKMGRAMVTKALVASHRYNIYL